VSTVGYAIPASSALGIVNQIRAGHGSSSIIIGQPGFLGVEVQSLNATIAAQLGLKVASGALVVVVIPGTPAALAGMSRYAVITAVDGLRISSADALGPAIRGHKPGEQLRVTWVDRAGGLHNATVRLITGPAV
jgi:S1-C subfamily serine protease